MSEAFKCDGCKEFFESDHGASLIRFRVIAEGRDYAFGKELNREFDVCSSRCLRTLGDRLFRDNRFTRVER